MKTRSPIPRLNLHKSTGGVDSSTTYGGGVRRRSGGGGAFAVLLKRPRVVNPGVSDRTSLGYTKLVGFSYYPDQQYTWPPFVLRSGCSAPISDDCSTLTVTSHWAVACFKPAYHRLRQVHGADTQSVVDDLLLQEAPACSLGAPTTGAEYELRRRVALSVASLMNAEGIAVPYPAQAPFPKPQQANQISQPWLRALLTGWL